MTRTVLIVDDHPSFRASARMLLEAEGYEVVGEAEDGQSALRAVEELRPDVVLLDVQLPDIDGIEVAARLTANGSGPGDRAHLEPRPCGPRPGARPLRMCAASFQRQSSPAPRWRRSSDIAASGPSGASPAPGSRSASSTSR